MTKYIIKRVLYSILILFLVSMIIYFVMRLLPNDFVTLKFQSKLNDGVISPEEFQHLRELYGLADNSFLGILKGYFGWLGGALSGDLGMSFKNQLPVGEVIFEHMWVSFGLSMTAFILQFIIAIPLGIRAATKQYGAFDYATTVFTMIGISLPSFFLAYILTSVFSIQLGWFPYTGLNEAKGSAGFWDSLYHLILPMITVVIGSIGGLMRHTRTNTLEILNQDFIRTARAKGLSEHKVVYKHVFRNTMVPIVTMTAGLIPTLFGGMMILESVFNIPGIGQVTYSAMQEGDIPLVMGYNMFIAILAVLGTLLSDITYMLVDPRIKINK